MEMVSRGLWWMSESNATPSKSGGHEPFDKLRVFERREDQRPMGIKKAN